MHKEILSRSGKFRIGRFAVGGYIPQLCEWFVLDRKGLLVSGQHVSARARRRIIIGTVATALALTVATAGGLVLVNRSPDPAPAAAALDRPIQAAERVHRAARGMERTAPGQSDGHPAATPTSQADESGTTGRPADAQTPATPKATARATATKTAKPNAPKATQDDEQDAPAARQSAKAKSSGDEEPTSESSSGGSEAGSPSSEDANVVETKSGPATFFGDASEYQPMACGGHTRTTTKGVALWKVPCGTMVRITSKDTGKSVVAPVEDRGPASWTGAVIDLLPDTWDALGVSRDQGRQDVTYEVLGD